MLVSSVTLEKTISPQYIKVFREISGDWNPIHHQKDNPIVHGALLNGFVSGLIGTKLPGPDTLLVKENLRFPNPCYVGDTVVVTVEITVVRRFISCKFNIINLEGDAKLFIKDL